MAEDNVKDKATSTESTTGANTSSISGIGSTPVTSVNSAVDDKKINLFLVGQIFRHKLQLQMWI